MLWLLMLLHSISHSHYRKPHYIYVGQGFPTLTLVAFQVRFSYKSPMDRNWRTAERMPEGESTAIVILCDIVYVSTLSSFQSTAVKVLRLIHGCKHSYEPYKSSFIESLARASPCLQLTLMYDAVRHCSVLFVVSCFIFIAVAIAIAYT